jgi:hypothetical protein
MEKCSSCGKRAEYYLIPWGDGKPRAFCLPCVLPMWKRLEVVITPIYGGR